LKENTPKYNQVLKLVELLLAQQYTKALYFSRKINELNFDEISEDLETLVMTFPGKSTSWYARSIYRKIIGVKRVGKRHWIVKGLQVLGDSYPFYNVIKVENGFTCDCFYHAYGIYRKKKTCSHIAAVVLSLKKSQKKIKE